MNTSTARLTPLVATALAVLIGHVGVGHAAAMSHLDDALSASQGAGPLLSGGQGCFDPQSWVWSAPRAERVVVAVATGESCEIGSAGCLRRPESLPPEESASAYESAALACALKRAQHEQVEGVEPFDDKSCFESELTLWSFEQAPTTTPQPFEGLSCSEEDPECRSMPPLPPTPTMSAAAPAVGIPTAPSVATAARALPSPPAVDGVARRGVRRRVDRPPAA